MALVLTENATMVCKHELGLVRIASSQNFVRIDGKKVMVKNDPEGRTIVGCPNVGATIKPCLKTLKVTRGYSNFVRIDGKRMCLETVTGLTDGTPPGTVKYYVRAMTHSFVRESEAA